MDTVRECGDGPRSSPHSFSLKIERAQSLLPGRAWRFPERKPFVEILELAAIGSGVFGPDVLVSGRCCVAKPMVDEVKKSAIYMPEDE
jgi:hypothetical protein